MCETELNEEQLNEVIELVRDESDERKPRKKKGPDTNQWNKLGISTKEQTAGGDMNDFRFYDQPPGNSVFNADDFTPMMELAEPKKKDGENGPLRGGGGGAKKKKQKEKGQALNVNQLPQKQVDYNKLFNFQ